MPCNDRSNDRSASVVGFVLRGAREALGITQEEAAMRADMDRAYISEVENGKRSLSVDRLLRLCGSMKVPAAKVIAEVEEELRKRRTKVPR